MADDYSDDDPQAPAQAMHPALEAMTQAFQTDAGQQWSQDMGTMVQDYLNRRQIVDNNRTAGEQLVSNLGAFKNNLVGMVQADPFSANLALDMVQPTIYDMLDNHPDHPDDQFQSSHDSLVGHMQSEIARASVMSMADLHDGAARDLMGSDRFSSLLSDDDRSSLDAYIDNMATARASDANARQKQLAQDASDARDDQTFRYLAALTSPGTYDLQFPQNWAQRVMKDPTLPASYTAPLLHMYDRFQRDGDAPSSDPNLAAGLLDAVANGGANMLDVLGHAGDGLRLADALTIGGYTRPQNQADNDRLMALNGLAQQGKDVLGTPENGAAGQAAFSRYMNWLLPATRAGTASLDPNDPTYAGARLPQFAPSGNDAVAASVQAPLEGRKSLDDIFGGRRGRRDRYNTD